MRHTLAILLFCLSCSSNGRSPPSPNPPIPPDTDLCGSMCTHLEVLKCEEGKPVYDSDCPGPVGVPNVTCTEFCVKQQKRGSYMNPSCVLTVEACPQIEEARQKTCPRPSL